MPDCDQPATWTLEEHLQHGSLAVGSIASVLPSDLAYPVCHHFWARNSTFEEIEDIAAGRRFGQLISEFSAMGMTFEADRLEAWEAVSPNLTWLNRTIPTLYEMADRSDLAGYSGWTCEPRNRQPIDACEFQAINNRTAAKES